MGRKEEQDKREGNTKIAVNGGLLGRKLRGFLRLLSQEKRF